VFDRVNAFMVGVILAGALGGIALFALVASERELLLLLAGGCALTLGSWLWFARRRRPS
jgi:hypothetical protein